MNNCNIHNRINEYYCKTCNKEICSDCVLDKNGHPPQTHEIIKLTEKHQQELNEMIKKLNDIDKGKKIKEHYLTDCENEIAKMKAKKNEELELIKNLYSIIELRYNEMLKMLQDFRDALKKKIMFQREGARKYLEMVNSNEIKEELKVNIEKKIKEYESLVLKMPQNYLALFPFLDEVIVPFSLNVSRLNNQKEVLKKINIGVNFMNFEIQIVKKIDNHLSYIGVIITLKEPDFDYNIGYLCTMKMFNMINKNDLISKEKLFFEKEKPETSFEKFILIENLEKLGYSSKLSPLLEFEIGFRYLSAKELLKDINFSRNKFKIQQPKSEIKKALTSRLQEKPTKKYFDYLRTQTTNPYIDIKRLSLAETLAFHTSSVNSLCVLNDDRIASCSGDKSIKIFNLQNFSCELSIEKHLGSVYHLSLQPNGNLISSSADDSIKIWKIYQKNFQCIKTLLGHKDSVNKAIQISDNRILSCSFDTTIKIWNSNPPFQCIKTMQAHRSFVQTAIELKNKTYFVSGSEDSKIKFWNSSTYECVGVIDDICCCDSGSMIEISLDRIIIGESLGVSVIDCINFNVLRRVQGGFKYVMSFYQLEDGTVIFGGKSGSNENNLFIIDSNFSVNKAYENCHDGAIRNILKVNDAIITCSEDKTIKIWKNQNK